jgi:GT2 family glycosyltransferase
MLDEARDLREWIEFHRLQGVERFYLYDNGSTDDTEEVVRPYVEEGIAELVPWPHAGAQRLDDRRRARGPPRGAPRGPRRRRRRRVEEKVTDQR